MKRMLASMVVGLLSVSQAENARGQAVQNIVLRNSFAPIGAGARGVGMGGAFIAVADDGTAVTFNPAGLAQLRRAELAIVGFASNLNATVTGSSSVEGSASSTSRQAIDFVGLAIPFDVSGRRLTFQVGYQRAVDLAGVGRAVVTDDLTLEELGIDEPGRVGVSVAVFPEQQGALHNVSAAAAFQVTDRLYLGTALNYWVGEWTATGVRDVRLLQPTTEGPRAAAELARIETNFEQAQSLRGFNLNLGFLLKYPKLSVGGALRLPFSGDYRLDETDVSVLFDGPGDPAESDRRDFGVTSRLHWPRSGGLGIAVRPIEGLTLATDLSTTLWSRASIEQLPDGALLTESTTDAKGNRVQSYTDRNFFDLLPQTVTRTSDTSQWRAGAEYLLTFARVIVPVRAGYFRTTSPFTGTRGEANSPIRGFTVGTGLNFDRFVFDVAYERRESDVALGLRRLSRTETIPNPTESVSLGRVVASMILRFDDDGAVTTFFRSLFTGPKSEGETE